MKYSSPSEYENLKHTLFELSNLCAITLIRQIEKIYLNWEKNLKKKIPKIFKLTRPLRFENDKPDLTSVQTYLIGELSSYLNKNLSFLF